MRYVITGEWGRNRLLRSILWLFLLYIALFWLTNALLFHQTMGFTPGSIAQRYLGSEESFTQPRSFRGMLESSHSHLFAMGMLLLTLTHLVLFAPVPDAVKGCLLLAAFGSALADEGSGWLIRYGHPYFAWLKLAGFLGLQGSLAAMLVVVGRALATPEAKDGPGASAGQGRPR